MITMSLLSFGLLTACGEKEEDTAVVTDTADTEETDTEDTSDTEETDTEDTSDTEETDDPSLIDGDGDGFTPNEGDCDDANVDINPNAFDKVFIKITLGYFLTKPRTDEFENSPYASSIIIGPENDLINFSKSLLENWNPVGLFGESR